MNHVTKKPDLQRGSTRSGGLKNYIFMLSSAMKFKELVNKLKFQVKTAKACNLVNV